jgi:parvulin-like peptidyl-prolyl isomerase
MTEFIQIGNFEVPQAKLFSLLGKYQLLPAVVRELTIDLVIDKIECNATETSSALERFGERYQLTSTEQIQQWGAIQGLNPLQLEEIAIRQLKIEKFKQKTWGTKIESYFLKRKGQLDRAVYSLIRTSNIGIAQEIYFRTIDGEQTFAEAASKYSEGIEAHTGGSIGPVELSVPHPAIAKLIATQPLGQICPPMQIDRWYAIVRPDRLIPAQLDAAMRQRLLDELFQIWVEEQLRVANLPVSASPAVTVPLRL